MTEVKFIVPGPPRGKGRPRFGVVHGRAMAFTDKKTRSEEGAIRYFASLAMGDTKPFDCAVELVLGVFVDIPKSWSAKAQAAAEDGTTTPTGRPDLDNIKKLVCDAMNGIVFKDDSQIVTAYSEKRYSREPRVTVRVRVLTGLGARG